MALNTLIARNTKRKDESSSDTGLEEPRFGLNPFGRLAKKTFDLVSQLPSLPLLPSTPPPRQRRRRSNDPFDFFGTQFVKPTTAGLNALNALNK